MRIKIVATLGPASMDYEIMREMATHGVRVFRLNFSHSNAEAFIPTVQNIRKLETELGMPLTAMADLCGPKIRIGEIEGSPRTVNVNERCLLGLPEEKPEYDDRVYIPLEKPELLKGLEKGMEVALADGMLRMRVVNVIKDDKLFEIQADTSAILTSNKGISFPDLFHPMPALTEKDRVDLHEALDIGVDAVAMSFVQNVNDVMDLKTEIKRHGTWVPVISKLERKNALDDLDAILEATDVLMVARGDLGLECSLDTLPVLQKKILRACRHAQKGAIVATQMLLSMVKNPIPTRAESTDVANAILDGADCVMLSEETAIGKNPVEAVKFISDVAASAEAYYMERIEGPYKPRAERDSTAHMTYAASYLAGALGSKALVSHSQSGSAARFISSRRPAQPIYALTPDERIVRMLNFFWGVHPQVADASIESHTERCEKFVQQSSDFETGDNVIITSRRPSPGAPNPKTNEIKLYHK